MKIAICISGQPRNVERAFPSIEKNLLSLNEVDVFVHTWFDLKESGTEYVNAGGHVASTPVPSNIINRIAQLYDPIDMIQEPQIEFDEKNYNERKYPGITPFFSISQRYSILKSQWLRGVYEKAKSFTYDAVIRLRFDFDLQVPIGVSTFDLNVLNTPNRCPHPGGIDDTFAIGSSAIMDVYADLYNQLDTIYNDDNIPFCDELLLGHHLKKNGVKVVTHPIKYDLIRGG